MHGQKNVKKNSNLLTGLQINGKGKVCCVAGREGTGQGQRRSCIPIVALCLKCLRYRLIQYKHFATSLCSVQNLQVRLWFVSIQVVLFTDVKQEVMRNPKSSCIHIVFDGLPNGITVTNILILRRVVSIPRNVH